MRSGENQKRPSNLGDHAIFAIVLKMFAPARCVGLDVVEPFNPKLEPHVEQR